MHATQQGLRFTTWHSQSVVLVTLLKNLPKKVLTHQILKLLLVVKKCPCAKVALELNNGSTDVWKFMQLMLSKNQNFKLKKKTVNFGSLFFASPNPCKN